LRRVLARAEALRKTNCGRPRRPRRSVGSIGAAFFVGFREQSGREFINPVDEILIFNPLGKGEIEKVIDLPGCESVQGL